ncbi:MAG TPA: hypothetical protein GX707_03490 [Epulopiscium sp.]|nr:hypothetical protein [Candidatus Epulonipiscium sp.]
MHYSNLEEDLSKKCDNVSVGYSPGYDMPVIHDEYAHIPCYNRTEHRRDPNVRNFWGESIKKFWDKIWNTKGALGGAIWAGIDETDIFCGGKTSLEWGIIDIWRRKKPEHYMTRKAYSPIVLPKGEVVLGKDHTASLEIENRFCHTNLSEVMIEWKYGELSGSFYGGQIKPREKGIIYFSLPIDASVKGCKIELTFMDAFRNKVDEYLLPVVSNKEEIDLSTVQHLVESTPLSYFEKEERVIIKAKEFHIEFSKNTGLLTKAISKGQSVLIDGPYMNVPYIKLGKWEKNDFKVRKDKEGITLITQGAYGNQMDVTFNIRIQSDASIKTQYTINHLYAKLPKKVKLRVGVDCGGLDELGVYYVADPSLDTLTWNRKGLWSIYPADHIARCQGSAKRTSAGSVFAKEPTISWAEEMKSYILNGIYDVDYKGTNDFRSLKENIYEAKLSNEESGIGIQALSDGSHSLRLEVAEPMEDVITDRDSRIQYAGKWYPMEDYSGSLFGAEMWSKEAGAYAECTFTGTGVVWYGPVDTIYGIAKVYIDGKLMDANIDQRVNGVDFPGSAAGYDKKYGYPLYSITGLENKTHTIRIEVTGTKVEDAGDSYIVIDYLRILTEANKEPIHFIINNDYNYPHIAWGNYTKPAIVIEDGYNNFVVMKL